MDGFHEAEMLNRTRITVSIRGPLDIVAARVSVRT
jgi:hypothetical protein